MTNQQAIDLLSNTYFPCGSGIGEAIAKAVEALKAQEPKVMTLEEAQNSLHNDIVAWVELKGKILCGGIRVAGTDYFTMQNNDVLDITDFDSGEGVEMYGKEVRCWTFRPTDEQREKEPWDDAER